MHYFLYVLVHKSVGTNGSGMKVTDKAGKLVRFYGIC